MNKTHRKFLSLFESTFNSEGIHFLAIAEK
ncbi:hypothetical protein J2T12_004309 [Paenibacillus anaericanus]|nr:hypothetical protein [Paenibacillus anaericanus]